MPVHFVPSPQEVPFDGYSWCIRNHHEEAPPSSHTYTHTYRVSDVVVDAGWLGGLLQRVPPVHILVGDEGPQQAHVAVGGPAAWMESRRAIERLVGACGQRTPGANQ